MEGWIIEVLLHNNITYCIVGFYRLFGSECLLLIHSEVFTKSTHPSTECVYWLTDAYHFQTLRTVYCY